MMSVDINNVTESIKEIGDLKLCEGSRVVMVKNHKINLTGLEFNLLNLLMKHSPDLLPRIAISQQLFCGTTNKSQVINIHISNLIKKLRQYSSGLCIQSMRGKGYYLVKEK